MTRPAQERKDTDLDFVRPSIRALDGYTPGEQPTDQRYIKLNTNENPYPPSPRVIEAVRACAGDSLRLYPDPMANALRDKAAQVYGFARDEILVGNGSDDLLAMIMRACVEPGDRVVFPSPTYSLYDTLVAIGGGESVRIPFQPDFRLPPGLAEAGGRVTFICSPNAPSGTAIPGDEIAALSRRVPGLLVIDEAYVDFADDTALELAHSCDNVIVLRTFSKSFSLAGLRIGLAFARRPIIETLIKVKDSYNVARAGIVAAVAALEDYAWMEANVRRVRTTRTRLIAALGELGFVVPPSQTNFVLARRPGGSLQGTYEQLKARQILVRYFATPELHDAMRITVGTDAEVDALLAALKEIAA